MEKILQLTGYSEAEYQQIKTLLVSHIEFIAPDKIAKENWEAAYQLLQDIDEDDTSFLALNFETNGYLWTGDKRLIKGLERKNYHNTITTDILYTKYFGSR